LLLIVCVLEIIVVIVNLDAESIPKNTFKMLSIAPVGFGSEMNNTYPVYTRYILVRSTHSKHKNEGSPWLGGK
jgi:hypothetical protein